MTRLTALNRHWKRWPPLHKMVAAFCGYKHDERPRNPTRSSDDPSGIGALIAMYPTGQVPARR